MQVKKYHSKVVSILNPLNGIYTIEFESLDGKYKYNPGQFLHLALDQEYDGSGQWPESRCFSIQSNPNENTLRLTYSVKGKFTRLMEEHLNCGTDVWLKMPYGNLFSQCHNKVNTVFIAGGTGITPFLSLFTDLTFSEYINPVLYAGFRFESMNLYHEQINYSKKINKSLKVYFSYQDKNGILDIERIHKENDKNTSFFISGPPIMIKSFNSFLITKGLNTEQIKIDDWE